VTTLPGDRIVVDASFLISIAEREPPAVRFVSVLKRSSISAINFGEVIYKLAQKTGVGAAATEATFCGALSVRVDAVTLVHVRHFERLKALDLVSRAAQTPAGVTPVKSLSLADLACLAYASDSALPVLTGDKHWLTLNAHGLGLSIFDYRDPALTV